MDAAGVIATYILDGDRPLTAESNGNTTFYLYGLGGIGEETNAWSYSLPDGTNTPRQLSNLQGEVTLSSRYTPWGDTLDTYGTGNFSYGYFGGLLDASTGLIYVGNGQYYDPSTGRFLTRDVYPNNPNPYAPWNPIGAIVGPLGLIALVFGRKKKGSKAGTFLVLLLVVGSVGMMLPACTPQPDFPYEPEPPQPPSPLEDTPIIDAPWVDEQDWDEWTTRPNSCGPAALYMFLHAEGINVDYPTLISQLAQERPGGYDGFCCSQGWTNFPTTPTPSPNGENWCNEACTSSQVLADVASKYYNLTIEAGDNWTRDRVHQKLMAGHSVLALVRAEFGITDPSSPLGGYFGHFVLIRGLVDQGSTVILNDSYPGDDYWNLYCTHKTEHERGG